MPRRPRIPHPELAPERSDTPKPRHADIPPSTRAVLTTVLDRAALTRLLLGWAGVAALALLSPDPARLGIATIGLLLAGIVALVIIAASGVVHQAEALARRLGEPYGTLVLTLTIVLIEVVLIAAVMLGPGEHATIARDSVMAVSMIIMGLVLGLCLLVGGLRYGALAVHRTGTSTYLVLLVAMGAGAFALPAVIGEGGSYLPVQAVVVAALTVGLYAFFLIRQMGAQAGDFQEVEGPAAPSANTAATAQAAGPSAGDSSAGNPSVDHPTAGPVPISRTLRTHRTELLLRLAVLVATVLPIVLLSHTMAALLDEGLPRIGAPAALSGVLIAAIVFTPETLTAVRAARGHEMQRVVNLCHGALVSTLALTIPTVLVIGLLTGTPVVLAESSANLLLLGAVFAVAAISAAAPRMTAVHGAVHLMLFALYVLALLS